MWRRDARRKWFKAQHRSTNLECGKFTMKTFVRFGFEIYCWLFITWCSFSLSDDPSLLCKLKNFYINFSLLAWCFFFVSLWVRKCEKVECPLLLGYDDVMSQFFFFYFLLLCFCKQIKIRAGKYSEIFF